MARVVKDAEVRREELLHTALELFLENGYERTTVVQITGAVGVAKGTFYHYFETKQDLLEQLADAFANDVFGQVEARLASFQGGAIERLRALVTTSSQVKFGRKEEAILVSRSLYSDDNAVLRHSMIDRWMDRTRQILVGVVEQGIAEGTFRVADAQATTGIWLSLWYDYGGRLAPALLDAMDNPADTGRLAEVVGAMRALEIAQERILGLTEGTLQLGMAATVQAAVSDT